MYDAIIVGARCAGAATGLLLARKGYRVLLVDRAHFPSDTISGHCILHRGTVRLQRWGLLDKVIESNCPPISDIATNYGDFTLAGEVPWIGNAPAAIAPRRTVLDTLLQQAAVEAGAELRQDCVVDKLVWDSGRVVGIQGHNKRGIGFKETSFKEPARIVIGADGKHSHIAKLVDAPMYMQIPSLTCWYMSYFSNYPCKGLEIYWSPRRMVITVPTNDGLVLQAIAWPHAEFHDFRCDIERNYYDTLNRMPTVGERLLDARQETPFYAMADVPGFFRQPFGNGWALVGDAGHHKDPVPAYGISDAFCDAELLAEAIDDGFSGRQPLTSALAEYEQRRNARAIPDHQTTCERATLENWDTPNMLRLRQALHGRPVDTSWFYAVFAKAVDPKPFFSPDNIQRLLSMDNQLVVRP